MKLNKKQILDCEKTKLQRLRDCYLEGGMLWKFIGYLEKKRKAHIKKNSYIELKGGSR